MPCKLSEICLKGSCKNERRLYDGAVMTPYVKLTFADGQVITIGNKSAPNINLATISSFTYGFQTNAPGFGCDLEIIDNGGAIYRKLLRACNKTIKNIPQEVGACNVDFGWMATGCDGNTIYYLSSTEAKTKVYGYIFSIDASFESGSVKIKASIRAPQAKVYETSHPGSMASQDNQISLKEALKKLFTEKDPKFKDCIFRKADGSEDGFAFRGESPDGPLGPWPLNQQNSLAAARGWLTQVVTKAGYGCILLYDNKRQAMVVQEDMINNDSGGEDCNRSLATYVVNGGNCSPVISFTPKISFMKGSVPGAGAATGGASTGDNSQLMKPDERIARLEEAGTQTGTTIQEHEWNFRSPNASASLAREAEVANQMAENSSGGGGILQGFTAELKIQGDPFYGDMMRLSGKTISIVFINPFYMAGDKDGCTWLQTSTCNTALSNKKYLITGVSHQIQNGSYTTTFELSLARPNADTDFDAPLGNSGNETFVDGEGNMGKSVPAETN